MGGAILPQEGVAEIELLLSKAPCPASSGFLRSFEGFRTVQILHEPSPSLNSRKGGVWCFCLVVVNLTLFVCHHLWVSNFPKP